MAKSTNKNKSKLPTNPTLEASSPDDAKRDGARQNALRENPPRDATIRRSNAGSATVKETSARASSAKETSRRNANERKANESVFPLGFSSLFSFLSFCLLCLLLLAAPVFLSGFWLVTRDYSSQALFCGLTACACLMLALHPSAPPEATRKASWFQAHSPVALCLSGFFAWCMLSALTTVYWHDTLLELARIGSAVAWFFIARVLLRDSVGLRAASNDERMISQTEHWQWLRRVAIGASIACGIAYVCWLAVANYRETKYASQAGTFFNSNLFATYCAMSLPLALSFALEIWRITAKPESRLPARHSQLRSGDTKSGDTENCAEPKNPAPIFAVTIAALLPTLILLGLLVSGSKGGFLAGLCGLAVFSIAVLRARAPMFRMIWRRYRIGLVLGALLFAGGAGFVASKTVVPRLMAMRSRDNNSTMFRAYTWDATRRMAQQRPLLGWGPGAFPSAYSQFAETGPTLSSHQSWLQIAGENGVPALLLLLSAFMVALWRGWRALPASALPASAWPSIAAALAALVALLVHGMTDAGWSMTSVVFLLMIAFAMLDVESPRPDGNMPPHEYSQSAEESANAPVREGRTARGTSFNLPWLGATLLLIGASWAHQRAIQAEDLYREAFRSAQRGEGALSLQSARDAVATDPLSARMQLLLAQSLAANGQDAEDAFARAAQLQPLQPVRDAPLRAWAGYRAERIEAAKKAASPPNSSGMSTHAGNLSPLPLWNRALELDPNNPQLRLARGQWLLDEGDARGWRDLEHIARLADAPYGRYAAVSNFVDLNFARAYIRLAERALKNGDKKRARALVERGLADVMRARANEATNKELAQAVADTITTPKPENIDPIEEALKELKKRIG